MKRRDLASHVVAVPAPATAESGKCALGHLCSPCCGGYQLNSNGEGTSSRHSSAIPFFSSDGVYADPPGFLQKAIAKVHAAGGFYIADEVQPGFARTGDAFWGFARHGVTPDIVTMGKPMGNGFPMAGLVTRPDLLARFCEDTGYFNTFGGNPVAAAAGQAVLDIIEARAASIECAEAGRSHSRSYPRPRTA